MKRKKIIPIIIFICISQTIFSQLYKSHFPSLPSDLEEKIKQAQTFVQHKDWKEAINIYKELLLEPEDMMVEKKISTLYTSLREYAKEQISKLPREWLETWRKTIDYKAKKIYKIAEKTNKEKIYRKILVEYPLSSYEEKTREKLGQIYLDEGLFDEAETLLNQSKIYVNIKELIENKIKSEIFQTSFYDYFGNSSCRINVGKLYSYIFLPISNIVEKVDANNGNIIWARIIDYIGIDFELFAKHKQKFKQTFHILSIIKSGDIIYYLGTDKNLYGLDANTGEIIEKKCNLEEKGYLIGIKGKLDLPDSKLYIVYREKIICLNKEKNKVIWEKKFISKNFAIFKGNDIFVPEEDKIYIISSENGEIKECITTKDKEKLIELLKDEDVNIRREINNWLSQNKINKQFQKK